MTATSARCVLLLVLAAFFLGHGVTGAASHTDTGAHSSPASAVHTALPDDERTGAPGSHRNHHAPARGGGHDGPDCDLMMGAAPALPVAVDRPSGVRSGAADCGDGYPVPRGSARPAARPSRTQLSVIQV
ncbi:hypothetical protein [Streptomyces sp. TR06-5]|uniref:hypothetical protein n=1 Tax=unclassified Streptomyces TaxID=2593676 RepID=UPI00399FD1AF